MVRSVDVAQPPDSGRLTVLRDAAKNCTACDLAGPATQTVFGEGPSRAQAVLVGEQPGDHEDRDGRPFTGPAGRLLDKALVDAGIDRDSVYVTNAVKHFRFERARGGKVRLHKTPTTTQVRICHPWLQAELRAVQPALVVALGATAAKALRGPTFRISHERGTLLTLETGGRTMAFLATVHPSAVLRASDRDEAYAAFVADLAVAAQSLG
jgi:uracil-DNA glycosylase family protein